MRLRTLGQLSLVVAGYAVAVCAGGAAVWLKNRGISEAEMMASSGMFAFGDAITFLLIASLVAIPPTLLLFELVAPSSGFLHAYSQASLLLSSTALLCAAIWLFPFYAQSPMLQAARTVSLLRVLAAPLCLLVVAPGAFQVAGPNRKRSLAACACELCAMGSFAVWVVLAR